MLQLLELISVSAQGKLGRFIQGLGGMDPIVWDGEAASIKFVLESTPEGDYLGPEHYELELGRIGVGSSYKIVNELLSNSRGNLRARIDKEHLKFLER